MTFTLNTGEFDLGGGFIGRGTILAGETYAVGASTTGVQGLLNTSGLEGVSYAADVDPVLLCSVVAFRSSNDALTGVIGTTDWTPFVNATSQTPTPEDISDNARFSLAPRTFRDDAPSKATWSFLNSSTSGTKSLVAGTETTDEELSEVLRNSSSWRFLCRDHTTALIHYPSTLEEGSIFAASCVNSPTQWGLWLAGEVGDRSGYFNRTQGYFAIVLLVNGGSTYFSAFSPAAADSTSRNDAPFRHFNFVPRAGQSDTKMSELLISRDLGGFESAYIGKIPGFFYIDPNDPDFDSYAIGDSLDINPVVNAVFEGRDRALIVGRWGADQALTASNTGALFTITSASPNRRTLENGRRIQLTTIAPTGMAINTNYWVINWNTTAFTFNLATVEGGSAITPSSNETGMAITAKAALLAMRCY